MKQISLLVGVLICSSVSAEIHQWTDTNGVVHYSDTIPNGMQSHQVKTIEVQDAQTIKSEMHTARPTGEYNQPKPEDPILSVASPSDNEFIRDNTGTVTISGITKNLQPGMNPVLLMDGNVIAKGYNPSVTLTNVDRGTHTIQIKATDRYGKVYASKTVSFTLQRAHK